MTQRNDYTETTETAERTACMYAADLQQLYTAKEQQRHAWCRGQLEAGTLAYRPLISIVVPVYRTPVRLLDEMISSVTAQIYPDWELCIANGSPEDEELAAHLEEWQESDARIRVRNLAQNGGISANTNACFAMVQGEYTAMLDHDDLLSPNALFEVVWCLQERPWLDFLYSDQDMLDEESRGRFNPLYKPQWSKDTMYSGNYITHFSVLRSDLIREIGGWDPATDGAQDWDLFLKAAEHTENIHGIPQILYHWRMAQTSTASSMETKTYALEAQLRAIGGHLERMGEPQAVVHFYNQDIFKIRVCWNRRHEKDISVILLDEGVSSALKEQVQLLRVALKLDEREIIVISREEERLRELRRDARYHCRCLCRPFVNWAEAYNIGASEAWGKLLLFVTDRVRPQKRESLLELADWAMYDQVTVAAPKIVGEDRMIREMGIALTKEGPVPMFCGCFTDGTTECGKNYWYRNVHAADYSCFAIQKSRHEEVGGFRAEAGDLAMPEYCMELMARGYRHVVTPYAVIERKVALPGEIAETAGTATEAAGAADGAFREAWETFMQRYGLPEKDIYYRKT